MSERDDMELLLARVEELRQHQRAFFAHHMKADKKLSMAAEAQIDALCREFRRRGYDPDRFKTTTIQKKLL